LHQYLCLGSNMATLLYDGNENSWSLWTQKNLENGCKLDAGHPPTQNKGCKLYVGLLTIETTWHALFQAWPRRKQVVAGP